MVTLRSCIRKYIDLEHKGGLIGIGDLATYCSSLEGEVYSALTVMQGNQELQIIKRYYCPEGHVVRTLDLHRTYCQECELYYSNHDFRVLILVDPVV